VGETPAIQPQISAVQIPHTSGACLAHHRFWWWKDEYQSFFIGS